MKMIRTISLLALAAAAFPVISARAQEPAEAGKFASWTAYQYKTAKGPVCYIVAKPVKSTASRKNIKRDQAFFIVTNRPGAKVHGEVNTIIGYAFKPNAPVKLSIDSSAFTLFSSGDGAWSEGASVDRKIVAAMKAGKTMSITGVSRRGTKTVDIYDLSGVTAAIKKIDDLCKTK